MAQKPPYVALPFQAILTSPDGQSLSRWAFQELQKIARAFAGPSPGNFSDIAFPKYIVANLPTPVGGKMAFVTDGTSGLAWGTTVTGGHSTHYLVWDNGTNWTVVGK